MNRKNLPVGRRTKGQDNRLKSKVKVVKFKLPQGQTADDVEFLQSIENLTFAERMQLAHKLNHLAWVITYDATHARQWKGGGQ